MKKFIVLILSFLSIFLLTSCAKKPPELLPYAVKQSENGITCEGFEWGMPLEEVMKLKSLTEDSLVSESVGSRLETQIIFSKPAKTAEVWYRFEEKKLFGADYMFFVDTEEEYLAICNDVADQAGKYFPEPQYEQKYEQFRKGDADLKWFEQENGQVSALLFRPTKSVNCYSIIFRVRAPQEPVFAQG